jgi:tripartite-type tricarboxylate transporter receptor subunit TctC
VLAGRGTPTPVIARLNGRAGAHHPHARHPRRLAGQGAEVVTMTAPEQDQFFAKERARWAQVIKEANVKLD